MEYLEFITPIENIKRYGKTIIFDGNVTLIDIWHINSDQNLLIYSNPTSKLYRITFCLNGNEGDTDILWFSLGFNDCEELHSAMNIRGKYKKNFLHRLLLDYVTSENGFFEVNEYLSSHTVQQSLYDPQSKIMGISKTSYDSRNPLCCYPTDFDQIPESEPSTTIVFSHHKPDRSLRFARHFFSMVNGRYELTSQELWFLYNDFLKVKKIKHHTRRPTLVSLANHIMTGMEISNDMLSKMNLAFQCHLNKEIDRCLSVSPITEHLQDLLRTAGNVVKENTCQSVHQSLDFFEHSLKTKNVIAVGINFNDRINMIYRSRIEEGCHYLCSSIDKKPEFFFVVKAEKFLTSPNYLAEKINQESLQELFSHCHQNILDDILPHKRFSLMSKHDFKIKQSNLIPLLKCLLGESSKDIKKSTISLVWYLDKIRSILEENGKSCQHLSQVEYLKTVWDTVVMRAVQVVTA
jgi:hypothetical protein